MSVRIEIQYEGELQCTAVHTLSGDRLRTDAPLDNRGRGEHFSPTDLVAAALGNCVVTVMAIVARDRDIDMTGTRAQVTKEMSAVPRRHISKLTVDLVLPAHLGPQARRVLERAAHTCPVHASLGPGTVVDLRFAYEPV